MLVFPGPRRFARLPALVPNFYLPALAPNLYIPALAPNFYLPALAPNLHYQPWLPICIYRPWPKFAYARPEFAYTNLVSSICISIYGPGLQLYYRSRAWICIGLTIGSSCSSSSNSSSSNFFGISNTNICVPILVI